MKWINFESTCPIPNQHTTPSRHKVMAGSDYRAENKTDSGLSPRNTKFTQDRRSMTKDYNADN